jgi:phage anti-repressor protein
MNQLVRADSVNFSELVSKSTNLSLTIQTKLVDKLKNHFNEEEQRWYIGNLYMYLNYHQTNQFPINLEDIFKLLGFSHKKNLKRTLENNFKKDQDYKTTVLPREHGQFSEETITMNVDTFKTLCMLVKTEQGKNIRKYYVKLENIYNEVIKEEMEEKLEEQKRITEEQQKLLETQQQKIELLEHKPQTHGFLSRRSGYNYLIKDRAKAGHYKAGMAGNVDKRLMSLNTASSEKSLDIYYKIWTYDCELLEKIIHSILQPFNITGRREWFYFSDETQVEYAIHIMNITCDFLNTFNFTSYDQLLNYIKNVNLDKQVETIYTDTVNDRVNEQVEPVNEHINEAVEPIKELLEAQIKETNIFKLSRQMSKKRTGEYKGVYWSKDKEKWIAGLKYHYNEIFLGYYSVEIDAAKAYNDYALFINEKNGCNYELNEIPDYISNPRDIEKENKEKIMGNKTSKYNGVCYDPKRKYYVAAIKYNGKSFTLGTDINEVECAKMYNQQAMFFNNEFNKTYELNEIPDYITQPRNIHNENEKKRLEKKSSKYHGVTFSKQNNKYKALLVYNKKQIHIGFFENEMDAVIAYNNKATEYNNLYNKNYKINVID